MFARSLLRRDLENNTFEKNAGSQSDQRGRLNHHELKITDSAELTGRFGGRLAF